MSVVEVDLQESASNAEDSLARGYQRMRAAFEAERFPTLQVRRARLSALLDLMRAHREEIAQTIHSDYGGRSRHETHLAELLVAVEGIKYLRRNLGSWMKPESRRTSPTLWPARGHVRYQPLGVVGVISPWNYPWQLAVLPVATALAAGNRVLLKPSELTPSTSALLARLLPRYLGEDVISVHTGGVEVGQAFSELPLDHLFYTGSTHVGRLIMRAASANLTPVTLELGGKSPALMHPDFDLGRFVDRVVYGKTFNAGQTCVAPDYALVPRDQVDAFVQAFGRAVAERYPTLADNPDYTAIINERHYARLRGLLEDAEGQGARLHEINPAAESLESVHKLAPTLVLGATDSMQLLQDEIFGPVLPVIPYDTLDEALAYINARPHPLALYYFDTDSKRIDRVIRQTQSGGVLINDTLLHVAVDDLPFGGIGPSGMGAYHGREGFLTFSHSRAVLRQSRLNATGLLAPPYGRAVERLIDLLLR